MSLSTLKFVKLDAQRVENGAHTSMIGKHHAADLVWRSDVWAFLGEGDLNRSGSPWDELCELSLANTLK